MTADPVHDYLEAHGKFEQATRRVNELVSAVQAAAHGLRYWQHVTLAGTGGFSIEMMQVRDVDPWPSPQEVRAALQEWHKARLDAKNTWNGVPHDKRGGLKASEEYRPHP